jgi:dolichyl-phosphate-mannose-protein mannosyltransferase
MLIRPPTPGELALLLAVPLLILAAVGWIARTRTLVLPSWLDLGLSGRAAPVAAGIVSAIILLVVWRSAAEPGNIHDEQAYILQAEIFARGHWTGQPPPIPEFFEQTHVFVEPRLAAKYPPGNSLMLVPGVWLGLPGIVPVIMSGVAGGLVFALARRLSHPPVALLTWALWSTSTTSLYWRASYYSQNASTVLWLLSIWALLRWTKEYKTSQLCVVSAGFAWMYLTRPLTAVALAIPAGVVVLVMVWRRRRWAQMGLAVAVAAPLLLLNPLWHARTTGDWRINPYSEYARQYLPFDKPGFGVDLTAPIKPRTPPLTDIEKEFIPYHAKHLVTALPTTLTSRAIVLMLALGEGWRTFLVLFAVLGVVQARGPARFGVISGMGLVLAYLVYAHPAWWTIYYTEVFAVFFFVASLGVMSVTNAALKPNGPALHGALVLMFVIMTPWLVSDVRRARRYSDGRSEFQRHARTVLAALPNRPAVVFVHYPPDHLHYQSLVGNTPDYRTAPVWLVYDRGSDNERLLRLTDRAAYRLHTETWTLERLR